MSTKAPVGTTFRELLDSKASKARREKFASMLLHLGEQIGFRCSVRGWCYLLQQAGVITKDEFAKATDWIVQCRRKGFLPIDFTAEEESRRTYGLEVVAKGTPVHNLTEYIRGIEDFARVHYNIDWWKGEETYVQMIVEKIDLVTLFAPVVNVYHIPITNARGWSSMLQRASFARRFKEAEARGMKSLLLYCGDHDPDGFRMSQYVRKNLEDLKGVVWRDGTKGYDPKNLQIHRFGLNRDFIVENRFQWIDNLITGSGKNLGSPTHQNHNTEYVQEYIRLHGKRKCEANVMVTDPPAARQLCRKTIETFMGPNTIQRFQSRLQNADGYFKLWKERTEAGNAIRVLYDAIAKETEVMNGDY